jgi:hypothetical protein
VLAFPSVPEPLTVSILVYNEENAGPHFLPGVHASFPSAVLPLHSVSGGMLSSALVLAALIPPAIKSYAHAPSNPHTIAQAVSG